MKISLALLLVMFVISSAFSEPCDSVRLAELLKIPTSEMTDKQYDEYARLEEACTTYRDAENLKELSKISPSEMTPAELEKYASLKERKDHLTTSGNAAITYRMGFFRNSYYSGETPIGKEAAELYINKNPSAKASLNTGKTLLAISKGLIIAGCLSTSIALFQNDPYAGNYPNKQKSPLSSWGVGLNISGLLACFVGMATYSNAFTIYNSSE